MTGTIFKALSGFYYVEAEGETVRCKARGRFRREKISPLVGDRVTISDAARVISNRAQTSFAMVRKLPSSVQDLPDSLLPTTLT